MNYLCTHMILFLHLCAMFLVKSSEGIRNESKVKEDAIQVCVRAENASPQALLDLAEENKHEMLCNGRTSLSFYITQGKMTSQKTSFHNITLSHLWISLALPLPWDQVILLNHNTFC